MRAVPIRFASAVTVALTTLTSLLLSSCIVDVNFSGTRFLCRDEAPACPSDFQCEGGVCVSMLADGGVVDGASPDAAMTVCPDGCTAIDRADVCFCDSLLDWPSARDACAESGSGLAKVADADTASAIRLAVPAPGNSDEAWLGGTDEVVEGEWRWLEDDELFWVGLADGASPPGSFADFRDTEPNQFMGNDEDCLRASNVGWNDGTCAELRTYFCRGL